MNNYVRLDKFTDKFMAPQFSWLYISKCNYAFILVLCIAFCVVYMKLFRNIITYLLSLGVFIFALYLSDTYASMIATVLIFVGQFLDYLWKAKWCKKLVGAVIIGVPGVIGCLKLYEKIGENRNILTLGTRTTIWKASWEHIINNPNGMIDFSMGADKFIYDVHPKNWWNYETYNCHNVFLNQIFRFSIPVGGIFTLFFLMVLLFALKRNFSFATISIIIALLIPLCMDYALTNIEFILFIIILFIMFFRNYDSVKY